MNTIFNRQTSCLLPGLALAAALHSLVFSGRAEVKLPALFSDHMVLQSGVAVPVWGWADPGEEVSVRIGGQTKTTQANAAGQWKVQLGKLKAGAMGTLLVQGRNQIIVRDVLAGEVWLCSGQSNMAMSVARSKNFEQEKAAANFPELRMFTVARNPQTVPQGDCEGQWVVCSPASVGDFSATAYFFGREIQEHLGGPVGLINSSYGGTAVEAWTSLGAQDKYPQYQTISEKWVEREKNWNESQEMAGYAKQMAAWKAQSKKAEASGKGAPRMPQKPVAPRLNHNYPANLYNGMIAPLVPYAIRGGIWYQGENNAGQSFTQLYGWQLETMIQDWRRRWGRVFPFAWVQLPEFNAVQPSGWVAVREGMLQALRVPQTGMAITLGLGEAKDIHPKNKQDVGKRLAQWALAEVYKKKGIASSGPLPTGHKIKGDEVTVLFQHADGGLVGQGGGLKGFIIAGADQKWVPAHARIEGNRVILSSPEVKQPVAVRYAWKDNPEFSLYNGAGLPATPFRTDSWPIGN